MIWRKAMTIATKDMDNLLRSKYVLFSLLFMPLLFAVLMPLSVHPAIFENGDSESTGDSIPNLGFGAEYDNLSEGQKAWIVSIELMGAIFLILPAILPTVLAADSFAGEKDRKTIHNLLAAPITEKEMYVGKVAGSVIPSLIATTIGTIIFCLFTAYFSYSYIGKILFPNWDFILQLIVLSPLMALISTNFMIWVSSKTSSTRDAQQLGGVITIVFMLVAGGSIVGVKLLSKLFIIVIGFLLLIINYFLYKIGINILDRDVWGST